MKKYFVIFILSLFIILPGCTDPIITEPLLNIEKPAFPHKGIIDVCCPLNDPLSGACNLVGTVMYYHEIISTPQFSEGLYIVKVSLEMDTEICDMLGMMHPPWTITESSMDTIIVNEEGIVILEKNYPVCNRVDIILKAKYLITTEGVGIAEISIHPVNLFTFSLNVDK
ncbi:MAG TPA: hypothetical protein VK870_16815 [Ignavibacteriaceae bacterium]|nr:hypothetical protein [Ignavibacteriaceae bacterium]